MHSCKGKQQFFLCRHTYVIRRRGQSRTEILRDTRDHLPVVTALILHSEPMQLVLHVRALEHSFRSHMVSQPDGERHLKLLVRI